MEPLLSDPDPRPAAGGNERWPGQDALVLDSRGLLYPPGWKSSGLPFDQTHGDRAAGSLRTYEVQCERTEVTAARLERIDGALRLTLDVGADRHEIGYHLREREMEWLHHLLVGCLGCEKAVTGGSAQAGSGVPEREP